MPTPEQLKELTRKLLAGEIDRLEAAQRARDFGRSDMFETTFRGIEANGHHSLMRMCAANLLNPREGGAPYFFRDFDIHYSLAQFEGRNMSCPIADGVFQHRIWDGPLPEDLGDLAWLGTLGLSTAQLEAHIPVRFIRGIDDLGVEAFANLNIHDRPFRLMNRPPHQDVNLACFETTPSAKLEMLRLALESLCLDLSDFIQLDDSLDTSLLPRWVLWRQDDNGNSFDVKTFASRAKAEQEARRFEATLHKQTYSVRAAG